MSFTRKHHLYLLKNKQQYNDLKAALTEVAEVYQVTPPQLENDPLAILRDVDVMSHPTLQKIAAIVTTFTLPPLRHLIMARSPDSAAIYIKVAYSALAGMYPHWERDLAFVVSPPRISAETM